MKYITGIPLFQAPEARGQISADDPQFAARQRMPDSGEHTGQVSGGGRLEFRPRNKQRLAGRQLETAFPAIPGRTAADADAAFLRRSG